MLSALGSIISAACTFILDTSLGGLAFRSEANQLTNLLPLSLFMKPLCVLIERIEQRVFCQLTNELSLPSDMLISSKDSAALGIGAVRSISAPMSWVRTED